MNKLLFLGILFVISRSSSSQVEQQSNMRVSNTSLVNQQPQLYHGIIMTICWCVVADLGIIFKISRCIPYNIVLHVLCFLFIASSTIWQLVKMNRSYDFVNNHENLSKKVKGHLVIALMMSTLMGIAVLTGIFSFVLQITHNVNPRILKFFRRVHKYIGYLIIVFGKIQVILGWILYDQIFALIIVITYIGMIFIFSTVYSFRGNSITQEFRTYQLVRRPLSSEQNILINFLNLDLPRNSLVISKFNYFIFNDCIYSYKSSAFHPGGRKIIQMIRGREVDRYIYGMYGMEEYAGLGRILHPENCFDLLQKPLMVLPKNPILQLPASKFVFSRKLEMSKNIALFYFEPVKDQEVIYREAKNLKHIGQYFKVAGFGFTRIYSCVISLTQENRLMNAQILQKLNVYQILYVPAPEDNQNMNTTQNNLTRFANSLIPPQTIMNIIPQVSQKTQQYIHEKSTLPLLIKKYSGNTFTNRLFTNPNESLQISGLKGRGLSIQGLSKGKVLLLVAGTGIFPFLDLLDIMFKLIVGEKINIRYISEHKFILQGLRFVLYGSFNQVHDLIIPTELSVMSSFRNPVAKAPSHEEARLLNPYFGKFRFNQDFVKNYIVPIPEYQLSMIYICGPPRMCSSILPALRKHNVPEDKIFLV